MISFLTESGTDFKETTTVGGFTNGMNKNNFDAAFESACDSLNQSGQGYDFMNDINALLKNDAAMESFKDSILSDLQSYCEGRTIEDSGNFATLYEQASQLFDNVKNDLVTESTRVGVLLPIKAIDLPLVVKSQLKVVSKDIVQTEVTQSPIIKKQIEQTYVVDPKSKKRWKYPQAFFNDEYKEIFKAGKGLPIKDTKVTLPQFGYDIIDNLTDATVASREDFTIDLRIVKVFIDNDVEVPLKTPIRVNLADGSLVGGVINTTVEVDDGGGSGGKKQQEVKDVISGNVDFISKTVSISSASGQIKKVVFAGNLSNEKNERAVTFDYAREDFEWKVEDGFRADVPFSLEELEDAKALLDMDLYKKTYNNIGELLIQMEDSQVLDWLDEEFVKYDGIELDPLDFNPFIAKKTFDCDSSTVTVALPYEYIQKQLKFTIDRFITAMADRAKLEDLTFVVYGNPKYIALLDPEVNWVVKNGDMVGGVKLNYSYGIMTSGDVKVQVVSAYKVNSKKLRFIPFPTNDTTLTFKHYKYSTHILTSANSAYRSPDLPGGSMTYIMGTSRYKNVSLQGIQGELSFTNAEFVDLD